MLRTLTVAAAGVAVLVLSACSRGSDDGSGVVDFDTSKVTNDLPPAGAIDCDGSPVDVNGTTYTLKSAGMNIDGVGAAWWFAPIKDTYDTFSLQIHFENGDFIADVAPSQAPTSHAMVRGERVETSVAVGESMHRMALSVPADVLQDLGSAERMSATINGRHAGTCTL